MKRGVRAVSCACLLLALSLPSHLAADVDVAILAVRLLDPYDGTPTGVLVLERGWPATLRYEVDVLTTVFDGEPSVTKKIVACETLTLKGLIRQCDLGAGFTAGQVEKQDDTKVHPHQDAGILNGTEKPKKACAGGTVVPIAQACPAGFTDQAAGAHPVNLAPANPTSRFCKHWLGQDSTIEVKVNGNCEIQEPGFVALPPVRLMPVPAVCVWGEVTRKVNQPGPATEQLAGASVIDVSAVDLGTYDMTSSITIFVEDAIDIDLSNNVFEMPVEVRVVAQIPTKIPVLSPWGLAFLALLLAGGAMLRLRRRAAAGR